MRKESKKAGRANPSFGPETRVKTKVDVGDSQLGSHLASGRVSVSLLYYQKGCECFSRWKQGDLKKFSDTIAKLRGYRVELLKSRKNLCEIHKGAPDRARFSRPGDLSPDIPYWEIKVDPSNKARMHGFFVGEVFFLVWLDKDHECFKWG